MVYPTQEQVDREIVLLAEWGKLGHGYSKSFRDSWANLNNPERLNWLEELVKEARVEQSFEELYKV